MRKSIVCLMIAGACAAACDKHDPILPGTRTAIFDSGAVNVMNTDIVDLPDTATEINVSDCPYTQDTSNVIWDGERKIFSGFPTTNSVANTSRPVCGGGYVYAGLTTGELVKINPKNRRVMWIADIYRASNLTGGASILDIVAPVTLNGDAVYVGGMGDAFCRVNTSNGVKKWCANIGTTLPYLFVGNVIFIMATDGNLYALRSTDGAAYWSAAVKKPSTPTYANGVITVGREKFDAHNGKKQ